MVETRYDTRLKRSLFRKFGTMINEETNAAYMMKKEVDKVIAYNYGCMSKIAIGLFQNVDYDQVAKKGKL